MEVKVVTGANYGDEGKGMVAYDLAAKAVKENKSVLSILYNGGVQRAHTANSQIIHCTGTGDLVGGTTFYDQKFVVDPIALWLTQTKVSIHPMCRIVLPCDVMINREKEIARGKDKHGSCGMGIFECVKRSDKEHRPLYAHELFDAFVLYHKVKNIEKHYTYDLNDNLYTFDNFMRAANYIVENCPIKTFPEVITNFDTLIFEGGQGLLLDQLNLGDFPHLTPSSVGSYNIYDEINSLNVNPDIYYISRSYMTRHGAGPMEDECSKKDINADIVDNTNIPNEWQNNLRFGFIKMDSLMKRIKGDFSRYTNATMNLVMTQLNYTHNKIATGLNKFSELVKPDGVDHLFVSDQKDVIVEK